ncbi:hypothetical protein GW17_00058976, partial [Ensete ventricosum]
MGRRREKGGRVDGLEVKLPSFFRCPISLEVMRSPVSLCTGVTYDRDSIQRWLDSGHRTCPATRLPLPSPVHLVPNLTLRRLIHLWSTPHLLPPPSFPEDLLLDLRSSSSDPLPLLDRLSAFFSSPATDESQKDRLASSVHFAPALVSRVVDDNAGLQALRATVRVLALVLGMDSGRELAIATLIADLDGSVSALLKVLKSGGGAEEYRIDAATVLESILSSPSCDSERRILIVEKPDLFPELVRLIDPPDRVDPVAADAGLRCLLAAAKGRHARAGMARAGAVPAIARALTAAELPASTAERALKAMEAAARSAEGRAAV